MQHTSQIARTFRDRKDEPAVSRFDTPYYDRPRTWIQERREDGASWDELRYARKSDEAQLMSFLQNRTEEDKWPVLVPPDWFELVDQTKEAEKHQTQFGIAGSEGALLDETQDNGLRVPQNHRSSWQCYKRSLNWKPEEVDELERSTRGILNRLSSDTRHIDPIKGLVLGYVQSGKTSSMEALMSMAADHGWNMFIVLSGMNENLRLQTLERMVRDLNAASDAGNLNWKGIEHPRANAEFGSRPSDLNFRADARSRYFTVCLKQTDRLKALINWLHESPQTYQQMKILIIDDEADQASISNTVKRNSQSEQAERRGINKLITDLVNGRHWNPRRSGGAAHAMNYVMYTATPYANLLNESSRESLYPRHFIWTLKPSDQYIGPNEIFGYAHEDSDADGLDMIRTIPADDLDVLRALYEGEGDQIPESAKDALAWFACSVAVMRGRGRRKPISMLVHTSRFVYDHDVVADAITSWINASISSGELMERCRTVYERETERLSKERWLAQMPDFGRPADEITDYPEFEDIIPELERLFSEPVHESRLMTDDGAPIDYGVGLHRVIDNSEKDGSERLVYPDAGMEPYPDPAPAFIIIGGNTLSRGLTLDGLVSSYFLRTSAQADTLMQMGRWFGYRRDYELLPRVWMTDDTYEKFRFLAKLEVDLRDDLQKYMHAGVAPAQYGPRILLSPSLSWLRPTSAIHMAGAVAADMDFTGCRPQTVVFDNDPAVQLSNISIMNELIDSLGAPTKSWMNNAVFWKGVSRDLILDTVLSDRFSFSERSRVFNELGAFREWIDAVAAKNGLEKWNVIVAGSDNIRESIDDVPAEDKDSWWQVGDVWLRKVQRSRMVPRDDLENVIDIKVLRSLRDHLADIAVDHIPEDVRIHGVHQQHVVEEIRENAGEKETPYLLIYRINRHSPANKRSAERMDLDTDHDLIGLQVVVPGDKPGSSYIERITVRRSEDEAELSAEEELFMR